MRCIIIVFICTIFSTPCVSQESQYNLKDGFIANGYDVVSYFNGKAVKGEKGIEVKHDGVKLRFASEENRALFISQPKRYMPQYGGWCAYAIGANNKKVSINPETYEIRNGKLYLFYNAFFTNTLEDWLEEGPEQIMRKANLNWKAMQGQ